MLTKLRQQGATLFDHRSDWTVPGSNTWKDYVSISEVDGAAGPGAVVNNERVTGRIKFPALWLYREGL